MVLKVFGTLLFIGFFLLLSVVVAVLGFSYYVKKQISNYEQSQTESHNAFVALLINILIKIAEYDNNVTKEEIKTIVDFFRYQLNYSHSQIMWVKELIKDARQSSYTMDELLLEFRQRFAYEPRLILVELIHRVIFTKDLVSEKELEFARQIAVFLEITAYDLQSIQSKYIHRQRRAAAASADQEYYDILGLTSDASFEEVKAAYRKLSQKCHPDKVNHLGEEFRNVAEERMKELNMAYQFLKKKYGQ